MGEKIEEYMDNSGNTVRDDDTVVYQFHVGVPERKISNAHKAAQTGPVREVTTVRKEIVPGLYGRVEVAKAPEGIVAIMIAQVWSRLDGGIDRSHALMSQDELTAAIDTLTQIRDAMENNP